MKSFYRKLSIIVTAVFLISPLFIVASCTSGGIKNQNDQSGANAESAEKDKPAAEQKGAPLAGTQWRLVEFQSMDDAQGTQRPDNPLLYIMNLKTDGTVHMQLNCNKATGSWKIEPSADPSSGKLEFGPLATTKALCPPPSMDELVASQAQWVRGYLLKDGKLYLSLMADGGVFAWEPHAETPYIDKSDAAIEQAILNANPDYKKDIVLDQKARYVYSLVDLNGDGKDEAIVYMMGSFFCGTGGCNMIVLTKAEKGYRLVKNFTLARTPVVISPESNKGWRDIWKMESGGGAKATYVRYVFDGTTYIEKERKGTERIPEGIICLAGQFDYSKGVTLEPKK